MSKSPSRKFRTPYSGDRFRQSISFEGEPSLTKQAHRDECDINILMARYKQSGVLPGNPLQPRYGDVSMVADYQASLNFVMEAHDSFMALPSDIRSRFQNDPAHFLDFVGNPANHDEMVKMGLITAPSAPASPPSERPTAGVEGGDAPSPKGKDTKPPKAPQDHPEG